MIKGIKCSTFCDTEAVIKKTEEKIKEARRTAERRDYAQDILLEAEALLLCSNYNTGNSDCLSCHSISRKTIQEYEHLATYKRKKTVKLY